MKKIYIYSLLSALMLASCGNQQLPSSTDTNTDTSGITVVIGDAQSLHTLDANGKKRSTANINHIATADSELLFYPRQVIITTRSKDELNQVLKDVRGKLIDNGDIPAAPAGVPAVKTRKVNTVRHQLIEIESPDVTLDDFKKALAKKGIKGTVHVNNQQTMNDFVKLQELRGNATLNAEPNLLAFQAAWIDAPEQTGGYTARNNWALNTYNPATGQTGLNVETAWQNGYTGAGVQVAIIDTGFVKEDYELNGYNPFTGTTQKWVSGYNFTAGDPDPFNTVTSSNGDPDPNGSTWHGYSVAQSAVGANGNNYGTSGVAPDANAYLFRVGQSTVPGAEGAYSYYDASRAVDTAVAWGADVINMSFSVRTPGAFGVPNSYLASALANAEAAGVINVAAAGNDGGWVGTTKWWWDSFPVPASWNSVISVGAVNPDLSRTTYSAWGPGVQVFGPGTSNLAPSPKTCGNYFTDRCASNPNLYPFSGTSNASPFIAGVAALMKQAKPSITTQQGRSLLINTATRNANGEAVVNAWAAVAAARNLP